MLKICLEPGSFPRAAAKRTRLAMKQAAAGIGSPLKYLDSIVSFCTLNLASLKAPQTTYMKEASQPSRPNGCRAQRNASSAGATPKATKSDKESYSEPNWLVDRVKRAILPSRVSKIQDTRIAMADASYLVCIAAIMAKNPQNILAEVNRLGRI